MAVHGQDDAAQRRYELVQPGQEGRVLLRHRVADGVGDVDRRRALLDRDGDHLGGELDVGARGIHRRELDVVDERAGVRDGRAAWPLDVLARGLQLVVDVDVRRGDEGVDARAVGVAHRFGGALDVGGVRAGEPGDDRAVDLARDRLHGLEVARRRDREAGLDHVDAQARELVGDLELLGVFSEMPGDCSPSRRVVSKMMTRSGSMALLLSRFPPLSTDLLAGGRPPVPPPGGEGEARGGAARAFHPPSSLTKHPGGGGGPGVPPPAPAPGSGGGATPKGLPPLEGRRRPRRRGGGSRDGVVAGGGWGGGGPRGGPPGRGGGRPRALGPPLGFFFTRTRPSPRALEGGPACAWTEAAAETVDAISAWCRRGGRRYLVPQGGRARGEHRPGAGRDLVTDLVTPLDRDGVRARCASPVFRCGVFVRGPRPSTRAPGVRVA